MGRDDRVPRPQKKTEYEIRFASVHAQRGWRDLVATELRETGTLSRGLESTVRDPRAELGLTVGAAG